MKPHSEILADAGRALFGQHWQNPLAAALEVNNRSVRRWLAGWPIPPKVWIELQDLLTERRAMNEGALTLVSGAILDQPKEG